MQNPFPYSHTIDTQRISTIRDQLAEDTYTIAPRQIANKIIALEMAFCKPLAAGMRATYHT